MRKKSMMKITILILLTVSILASFDIISPVSATQEAEILSHTGYIGPQDYYHVVGEVKNTGTEALGLVKVEVSFYNSTDDMIASIFDLTMLDQIMVDRRSPFEIILMNTDKAEQVEYYEISLKFSPQDPKPQNLVIPTNTSFMDGMGHIHIVGNITNNGTENSQNVKIAATFYNETGSVVAVKLAYLDPVYKDLDAGETKEFEVILDDEDRAELVDSYDLTAESVQYSIIPEFSTVTSIIFILLTITAFLAAFRSRARY